jgi:hypothetical protein
VIKVQHPIKVTDKVTIENLVINDPQVLAALKAAEKDGHDLAEYVSQAIAIGIKALLATGVSLGIEVLADGIKQSKDDMKSASKEFEQQLKEKVEQIVGPKGILASTVNKHLEDFASSLAELTGGENSPIREGIQKQLDASSKKLTDDFDRMARGQKTDMFKMLDMNNPESPLKRVSEDLHAMAVVVSEVRDQVKQNEVVGELMSETTKGGDIYEVEAIKAMQVIAGWAGDDCLAVGNVTGRIPKSKKGDGVVDLRVGATVFARIAVECKDSNLTKTEWIKEAEGSKANRAATGFIGLCKSQDDMPGKNRMVVLDAQSIVLAYDPQKDDPQVLHLVYQVVKLNTLRATGNLEDLDMASINKQLEDALAALKKFDNISKQASAIENSVKSIRKEASEIRELMTDNIAAVRKAIAQGIEPAALQHDAPLAIEDTTSDQVDEDS